MWITVFIPHGHRLCSPPSPPPPPPQLSGHFFFFRRTCATRDKCSRLSVLTVLTNTPKTNKQTSERQRDIWLTLIYLFPQVALVLPSRFSLFPNVPLPLLPNSHFISSSLLNAIRHLPQVLLHFQCDSESSNRSLLKEAFPSRIPPHTLTEG
ncbi:hypothetical protein, unlikely [Trypanosoma brucei brucei TREU927]|uniref:Uncharacterized protein n=1 Tax=Trypanosoma brucei brucei (strain 927/4 GUTat10.1) TaxID=185431 RepID=Q38E04_TRYB2|nr:hypothetical protein, unlikely [Trypanosoma brucei brucei TREU927]EAN76966.1 hypothetical protein, unlikely [Trypanosoma brucei brucei TREU927]